VQGLKLKYNYNKNLAVVEILDKCIVKGCEGKVYDFTSAGQLCRTHAKIWGDGPE
jgi:hypothetical protein